MRKFFAPVLFGIFVVVASAQAQQQNLYYVFNGKTLEIARDNPAHLYYRRWQVWLFQQGVHIPHYTASLQYSRWGLIEGPSAAGVTKQLKDSQNFQEAYLTFFGPDGWGRYTFFNPLGPIVVAEQDAATQSATLEELNQLRWLDDRLNKLITTLRPSLENNEMKARVLPLKNTLIRSGTPCSELARCTPN